MAFQVGDVVELKSGGVAMTVVGHDSYGDVECVWQDKDSKGLWAKNNATYPEAALISHDEASSKRAANMAAAAARMGGGGYI